MPKLGRVRGVLLDVAVTGVVFGMICVNRCTAPSSHACHTSYSHWQVSILLMVST